MKIASKILTGIFVAAMLILSACSADGNAVAQPKTQSQDSQQQRQQAPEMKVITVGSVGPLTGDGAVYGLPIQRVYKKAVEDLNEKWATKNMKMEVIYDDGKCNGVDALKATQNIVELHNVKIILGALCSGETLGLAPYTEQKKVLVFSALSSSPDVSNAGDYVFRNYPSDVAQVDKMVEFIKVKGWKSVAILSENTDYAQALRKGYQSKLPAIEVKILSDEAIAPGTKDVRTELSKIKAKNPEAVILLPQTIPTAGIFAKQLYESGYKGVKLGNEISGISETVKEYKEYLIGIYYVESYFGKEKDPDFLAFAKEADCGLGFYCATTYDSVMLMGEMIEACGEDTDCIRDNLYATKDWKGRFTDAVTFDSKGDVSGVFKIKQMTEDGPVVIQ